MRMCMWLKFSSTALAWPVLTDTDDNLPVLVIRGILLPKLWGHPNAGELTNQRVIAGASIPEGMGVRWPESGVGEAV